MNFATIIKVIAAIPQLLTIISTVVQQIEATMNLIPGITGNQKLLAAEAQVNSLVDSMVKDTAIASAAKSVAEPLIESAVAAFNAAKVFVKTQPVDGVKS